MKESFITDERRVYQQVVKPLKKKHNTELDSTGYSTLPSLPRLNAQPRLYAALACSRGSADIHTA